MPLARLFSFPLSLARFVSTGPGAGGGRLAYLLAQAARELIAVPLLELHAGFPLVPFRSVSAASLSRRVAQHSALPPSTGPLATKLATTFASLSLSLAPPFAPLDERTTGNTHSRLSHRNWETPRQHLD